MPSREQELTSYIDELRDWAIGQATGLWRRIDPERITESWADLAPLYLAMHRTLVALALDAVDDYLTLKQGDVGASYDVVWTDATPDRVLVTHRGVPADRALALAPIIVLSRMKRGHRRDAALVFGLHYLQALFGSEAHETMRAATRDRVAEAMRVAGR